MKEEISKLLKTAKQITLKMFIDYQSSMYSYILFINYYNNFSLKYYFFLFFSFFLFFFISPSISYNVIQNCRENLIKYIISL